MLKKAAILTLVLIGSASLSFANGATHHNNSQTTMIGSFNVVPATADTESNSVSAGDSASTDTGTDAAGVATDERGCSTLVTADIHNKIKKAGDITSIVEKGRNNQANAASVVVTGRSKVSGSLMNTINTSGDLKAVVRGGRNNLANAGTISVKGAVSSGTVINEVKNTGDITSIVKQGRNNQANAA
ncbi:MAG TPA: hypothetical protein ENK89_01980, partial [Desulfobulbaceae bacterium]|nr:hypothetical protein [Desulfobulbaceae bacterium]